jgi:hypothetical protein
MQRAGDFYADEFVYWGVGVEALRRLAALGGFTGLSCAPPRSSTDTHAERRGESMHQMTTESGRKPNWPLTRNLLSFDVTKLADCDTPPRDMLRQHGDLYRHDLGIALWLDQWREPGTLPRTWWQPGSGVVSRPTRRLQSDLVCSSIEAPGNRKAQPPC